MNPNRYTLDGNDPQKMVYRSTNDKEYYAAAIKIGNTNTGHGSVFYDIQIKKVPDSLSQGKSLAYTFSELFPEIVSKIGVPVNSKKMVSLDIDYMDAIERGDMETVQRMVAEAAKAAGFVERPSKNGASFSLDALIHHSFIQKQTRS